MSKILFTYEFDMPTVALTRSYTSQFCQKTGAECLFRQVQEVSREDLAWCNVLEMLRPNDPYSVYLAKQAQNAGKFVISFYDDDLYNLPDSVPNPFWRKNSILKVLSYSNVIHSSSAYISEKYRNYTMEKRSYTSDTIVNCHEMKLVTMPMLSQTVEEPVKLIYAANPGHVSFYQRFIQPIMPQLCERYGSRISMTFMGVRPDLKEFESQIPITYYSTMPMDEYRAVIKAGNFHIGLSPLTTDEFTKCKYFNKFIEYTIAGITGVYSETEPYTYVVRHRQNGFLVKDDPQDWYQCLCEAIDNVVLRNQCICAAQAQLCMDFTADRIIEEHLRAIPEIVSHHASGNLVGSLQLYKFLHCAVLLLDRVYQVMFYLKHLGLSGVINKIKVHIRESKAYSN